MKRFTTVLALAALAACSRTPAQEAAYQRQVRDEIHLQDLEASRVADSIQHARYAAGWDSLRIEDSIWSDNVARALRQDI